MRLDPTVNGNGGGGSGNGGADSATVDTLHRPSGARRLRHRSPRPTRPTATTRSRSTSALDGAVHARSTSGFAGAPQRRACPARRVARAHARPSTRRARRQRRPDRAGRRSAAGRQGRCSRSASAPRRRRPSATAEGSLGYAVRQDPRRATGRAGSATTTSLDKPRRRSCRASRTSAPSELERRVLPERQRHQGLRGQDVPGRDRRQPRVALGPGGLGRRPAEHLLRLLPRGLRARPVRGLDRASLPTATSPPPATRRCSSSTASSCPDGSMPRNSLVNGKTGARLVRHAARRDGLPDPDGRPARADRRNPVRRSHQAGREFRRSPTGPSFGVERWEEQSGYSPSTIAAEIAGLVAAAHLADVNGDATSARDLARRRRRLPALDQGLDGDDERAARRHPYFIRLSKTGDPNAAISYNVGNGGPTLDQRAVIDAGFLELTRLGVLPGERPRRRRSRCRSSTRRSESTTPSGPGWHRYNGDGYGDGASDGHPWAPSGQGTGHLWPALSAERGEQYARRPATRPAAARSARRDGRVRLRRRADPRAGLGAARPRASPFGTDPTVASIGFRNGGPAGSAAPLTWSAASFVRLAGDLAAGRYVDAARAHRTSRYVAHAQGATDADRHEPRPTSRPSPARRSTVTGTTAPGNTVYVAGDEHRHELRRRPRASTTAARDGTFSVAVPITRGTTVLNVVAVSPSGGTAHVSGRSSSTSCRARSLLDVTDPNGDDNGPGNYAYPTSANFQPARSTSSAFQVFDNGTRRHLPAPDARPDARPSAARSAPSSSTSTSTIRARAGVDLDRGLVPAAQLLDRRRRSPGAG